MPECVETEITRLKIRPLVEGRRLLALKTWDPFLTRVKNCAGVVRELSRHGKSIYFHFTDGRSLRLRLAMSGALVTEEAFQNFKGARHRVLFEFEPEARLFLVDPRRFARLECVKEVKASGWDVLSSIAQEAMPDSLDRLLRGSRSKMKTLLMNQTKIAGIGNAYANEILFESRISPFRSARRLKKEQRLSLWSAIRRILARSLAEGGISMRNYFHPDGGKGRFQESFQIYGKKTGAPCVRCGFPVKVRRQSQRSTFYCAGCQK